MPEVTPLEYVDGMSLYRGYFVPGAIDPTGQNSSNCKRVQRKLNIKLPSKTWPFPIWGPVGIYVKVGGKAEADLHYENCDVCCDDGSMRQRRRTRARLRIGAEAVITGGISVDQTFGPGRISGYIGLQGQAWGHGLLSGEAVENECTGDERCAKVCGAIVLRLRGRGGATFKFQSGRWFSWDVGVEAYVQNKLRARVCATVCPSGIKQVKWEGFKWGQWKGYVEGCFGNCYRYQFL